MGECEGDDQEDEGLGIEVTDMGSALIYMRSAVHRLVDMTKMLHDLWMEFDHTIIENAGRIVQPEDEDAADLAERMAFLIYNAMRFMRLIDAASAQMAHITFDNVCPPEIRARLAVDTLQQITGVPWSSELLGEYGIMFHPEQVVVPDEMPDWMNGGEDGEGK